MESQNQEITKVDPSTVEKGGAGFEGKSTSAPLDCDSGMCFGQMLVHRWASLERGQAA